MRTILVLLALAALVATPAAAASDGARIVCEEPRPGDVIDFVRYQACLVLQDFIPMEGGASVSWLP